ncbi:MAG: type II secretion system F family protein [Propionibacteriaceae bacterium]|nr:type II secretion system F family protein [Propionibacteriaceae bacterium]
MTSWTGVSPSGVAVVAGALAAAGLVLAVLGLMRRPVSLKTALAALDDARLGNSSSTIEVATTGNGWIERRALQLAESWHWRVNDSTQQRLAQQGRTLADFMTAKLLLALAGLVAPALITGLAWVLGLVASPWPLGIGVIGAVLGFFWPDFALRQDAGVWQESSADAVSVYFDLVTLIRLGNASAVQALTEAAELADAPVFLEIRDALTRARLQQRPPWAELHQLAERLDLSDIADLADIMALDEQGAALVEALRARVRELRKAHLAQAKLAAQKQAESMTVWMVVPVLVFALLFLIPPLMTMMTSL